MPQRVKAGSPGAALVTELMFPPSSAKASPLMASDAVLMSRVDYDALQETAYLLRVPANARRLLESLRQSLDGQREEHEIT